MDKIQSIISNEPVTGLKRIARHENFVVQPDLNMVQQVRIISVDETGQPLTERITADQTLTEPQRQAALQRYADQLVTRQTGGAFVDATGQVVPAAEGAIPQRDFFQGITLGDMEDKGLPIGRKTSVASLIYALIHQEISNLDNRGAY